jgi:Xaa-Pro aminopeptidase
MSPTSTPQLFSHGSIVPDFGSRRRKVSAFLADHRSESGENIQVLLTRPEDIRWLCGFTGSNGWLLVSENEMRLLTDGRYTDQAQTQTQACGVEVDVATTGVGQGLHGLLNNFLQSETVLWFQSGDLTVSEFESLRGVLTGEMRPCAKHWDALRRRKDEAEIQLMATAAGIADAALEQCRALLGMGVSERDFRDEIEYAMRKLGADGPSYETIVASGPQNAARPHHRPTATLIEPGHTVVIDVGALVNGYHSDMTRSFVIGDMSREQNEIYDAVQRAQKAGVEAVAPGVPVREVDQACRKVLQEAGLVEFFTHGTGHGVGLAIHEEPFLNQVSPAVLEVGDVVTVEPGVYRRGFGGFRVEDLLVVTETGSRQLTLSPKDPTCLLSPRTT